MDRITVRGRVAATSALLLVFCAPSSARAAAPSAICSVSGAVLTLTLSAGDAGGGIQGAKVGISVIDRAGTVGVRQFLSDAVAALDCGGVRVRDLSTIAVIGSAGDDAVRISEEGAGGRSFGFPSSVAFDVDLAAGDGSEGGDLLELVVRPEGGTATIGTGVFSLGAASGTFDGVEAGTLRAAAARLRPGVGPLLLDGSGAPAGLPLLLLGASASDTLRGGAGDDLLFGAEGSDLLDGGPGIDLLDGGLGRDRCLGGEEEPLCEIVA